MKYIILIFTLSDFFSLCEDEKRLCRLSLLLLGSGVPLVGQSSNVFKHLRDTDRLQLLKKSYLWVVFFTGALGLMFRGYLQKLPDESALSRH